MQTNVLLKCLLRKKDKDFAFLFFSSSLHSIISAESSAVIFCFWEISKTVEVR